MPKAIHLSLTADEFGLLFDGLCVREYAWRQTAMLMREEVPEDLSVCEECNGMEEAEALELAYSKLVANIHQQYRDQMAGS